MKRKYDKQHKDWAKAVKDRDNNKCIICGATTICCSHHLIPWEDERFRLDTNNGITLCSKHHSRYGKQISPHNDYAGLFFLWLNLNKPEIWRWFCENVEL